MPLIISDEMIVQIDDMARKRAKLLWQIRDGIMTVRNVAWMQEQVEGCDWLMHEPYHWMHYEDNELHAEVVLSPRGDGYTAIIWLPENTSECGNHADGYDAICWSMDRMYVIGAEAFAAVYGAIATRIDDERAAALNTRVDELERTGAEDASEGPMNPEHLEYGH